MRKARQAVVELAGREVVITNPDKPFFPQAGHTKLHLVRYYAAVAEGALRGIAGRPIVLKRYVDGAAGEPFFQKRAPEQRPGGSRRWSCAFRRGGRRERLLCATRRSFCGW
jgi:bifunctional non-homologous end joining protein LigD